MMKNRSFMSGLGMGLIIGAVLLQLMIIGEGQLSSSEEETTSNLSREQIEEQAKALDLKVTESSQQLLTVDEWKQQMLEKSAQPQGETTKAPVKATQATEPDQPSTTDKPVEKTDSTTSKVQNTVPVKTPVAHSKNDVTKLINYKIMSGSSLTDVAKDLTKIGVITNSDQFIKEAVSKNINRKIRAGSYIFIKGESNESVISKIQMQSSR